MAKAVSDAVSLEFTHDDRAAHITLDRAEKMNAITPEMAESLVETIHDLEANDTTRVMVLRGAEGTFCTGADLGNIYEFITSNQRDKVRELEQYIDELFECIAGSDIPSIAVVEGYALAGGMELFLCSDITVCDVDATIGDQHVNNGLIAGGGATQRIPRLAGVNRAKELILTGKRLSGREALEWNLVNDAVELEALDEVVEEYVESLTTKGQETLARTKHLIDESMETDLESGIKLEREVASNHLFSGEAKEGLRAFNNDESPEF